MKRSRETGACGDTLRNLADAIARKERPPFVVALIDPPWSFSFPTIGTPPYDTMTLEEIANVPVDRLMRKKDAVIFLWTAAPHLPVALDIMRKWGFCYRSYMYWRKTSREDPTRTILGLGYWVRSSSELLLIGRRANTTLKQMQMHREMRQEIEAPRGRHSAKPFAFREAIAGYIRCTSDERIELFARDPDPAWTSWGLELDGYLILPAPEKPVALSSEDRSHSPVASPEH